MPRPNQIVEQRRALLPLVAKAFSDLGYRRATTAEIARYCAVRENILYRLWKDKKAMFIASIHYVYDLAVETWTKEATRSGAGFSVTDVLEYEAKHLGEFGHFRMLFAGLGETNDPEIRTALAEIYREFFKFIRKRIAENRREGDLAVRVDAAVASWALIGIGTVSTLGKELDLMSPRTRKRLLKETGALLVDGA